MYYHKESVAFLDLCEGKQELTGKIPLERTSTTESVYISWFDKVKIGLEINANSHLLGVRLGVGWSGGEAGL